MVNHFTKHREQGLGYPGMPGCRLNFKLDDEHILVMGSSRNEFIAVAITIKKLPTFRGLFGHGTAVNNVSYHLVVVINAKHPHKGL